MNKFLLFYITFFITLVGFSQQPCIREARGVYEDGRLHELPALLENCLDNSFNKQEKVEAYRLLTLSYIYSDEPEKADEAMLNLLRTDPEFVLNESVEPDEFIALYKTFRTDPIFRFGVKLGVNGSKPNAISVNGTNDLNDLPKRGQYQTQFSFRSGLVVEIPLTKFLTLDTEANFSVHSFNNFTDPYFQEGSKIKLRETQGHFELALLAQYSFINEPNFKAYLAAGPVPSYLMKSEVTNDRTIPDEASVSVSNLRIDQLRKGLNFSAGMGAGMKIKVGPGFYIFEIRYTHGFTNLSVQSETYNAFPTLAWDNRYADSEFSLSYFSINVFGYVFNQFKPKKLK